MNLCQCVIKNRLHNESQREWLKRCMCMHHWMETDYYKNKEGKEHNSDYAEYSRNFPKSDPRD